MYLNKKLFFRIAKKDISCFCGTLDEVKTFLWKELQYKMDKIESQAVDYLLRALLPFEKPKEKRSRFLLVANDAGVLGEFSEYEELPYGWRRVATVFTDAFTERSNPVARFDLRPGDDGLSMDVSRFRSDESMPIRVAENAWAQQAAALYDHETPYVMADVSILKGAKNRIPGHLDLYMLKIGEDVFPVRDAAEVLFVLKQMLRQEPKKAWNNFLQPVFRHLQNFPRDKVFHESVDIYVDTKKFFHVGGEGRVSTRRFYRCGLFYPEYFCGGPGPLVKFNTGSMEDVIFDFYLFRPDASGKIPDKK